MGGGQLIAGEQCSYVWPSATPAPFNADSKPCTSPFYVNSGLTCGMVKNTCGGWTNLDCTKSGATCTGPQHTGGGQLVAGEECTYVWPTKLENPCTSPFYVNSGLTCSAVGNTCGGWTYLDCTKSGATCTGPSRTGGGQLVSGEYCSYVWPPKVDACNSPFKVTPRLTCGMVKNTCTSTKLENPCTSPFYVNSGLTCSAV